MTQPIVVRIVVVEGASAGGIVPALARLGAEVAVETLGSASAARARLLETDVDLLVVEDDGSRQDIVELVGDVREAGPPAIVVLGPGRHAEALGWYRLGAADCVDADSAEEALPIAALDLIRRHRAARDERDAERRIASLRRYTKNIIQNISSALLVVDGAGRITYANGPAEELLGEPAAALLGRAAAGFFVGHAADVPLLRSLEKGERVRGAEAHVRRAEPEGAEPVPVAMYCGPMRDDEGRELGAVAILQDLSEMRRLQRQLFQSEKMASIGQLAAGVAHEINNPAGFIDANLFQMEEYVADLRRLWRRVRALEAAAEAGEAEALGRELAALRAEAEELDPDFLIEDLGKAIRESREGSERIRHIVQDLRSFARPDGEQRVWADVNQCVDSTANIVWSMMKHAVELRKDYGELPALSCHPGRLKQVFMNLLMNAYQAVVARVGDSGALGEIAITTRQEGDAIVVTVADDGVGIAADELARIFDPFFTTREVGTGTGLGLSTAFHLVASEGGRIEAESRQGEGATFRVILPLGAGTP